MKSVPDSRQHCGAQRFTDEIARDLCELVPKAKRETLLREVDAILQAWRENVKRKRSIPSSQEMRRRVQAVALHADRLFTAMHRLDVGEGQPEPFGSLDWRRAHDPLLKIILAASLIARPNRKEGKLLKFITSFSTALPLAQAQNRDRMWRQKTPNWPLGFAVAALVACFRRHNTVTEGAKVRERRFVLRVVEAGGVLTKGYSTGRMVRDYLRKVRVGPEGFGDWHPGP